MKQLSIILPRQGIKAKQGKTYRDRREDRNNDNPWKVNITYRMCGNSAISFIAKESNSRGPQQQPYNA